MIKKWCRENTESFSSREIIEECNHFLRCMDGSFLTNEQEKQIQDIYNHYPDLMYFICAAYREKGYNEF